MSISRTTGAVPPREAPKVGDYRRGSRVRTTRAGTWFPAIGPEDQPAGLLLLHPAVQQSVLRPTLARLAELDLPGVLPVLPELVTQAGRAWLVATAAPGPTLADLLDEGPHRDGGNAAALLADIAATLRDAHRAGLAHGGLSAAAVVVSGAGVGLLADWGTDEHADAEGDLRTWGELAGLLADRWCAESVTDAAVLARAVHAAEQRGADGGLQAALDQLRELADTARRDLLAEAAARPTPRPAHRTPVLQPSPESTRPRDEQPWQPPPDERPSQPPPDEQPWADEPQTGDPVPPPDDPAPSSPGAGRWARSTPVLLAIALALLLVGAAGLVVRPFEPDRPSTPVVVPSAPLDVRSVAVESRLTASVCVVIGTLTTNGQPGRVVYRWVGENGSQAVATVSAAAYSYEVEVGLVWSPSTPPLGGSSVTLQILEPRPSATSALVPLSCI